MYYSIYINIPVCTMLYSPRTEVFSILLLTIAWNPKPDANITYEIRGYLHLIFELCFGAFIIVLDTVLCNKDCELKFRVPYCKRYLVIWSDSKK